LVRAIKSCKYKENSIRKRREKKLYSARALEAYIQSAPPFSDY
jgi:hypothetical protein